MLNMFIKFGSWQHAPRSGHPDQRTTRPWVAIRSSLPRYPPGPLRTRPKWEEPPAHRDTLRSARRRAGRRTTTMNGSSGGGFDLVAVQMGWLGSVEIGCARNGTKIMWERQILTNRATRPRGEQSEREEEDRLPLAVYIQILIVNQLPAHACLFRHVFLAYTTREDLEFTHEFIPTVH